MSLEYRVVWRREHDKRKRSRLYQTIEGARRFAQFIAREITDDYLADWAFDYLVKLGEAVDVTVECRPVGEWNAMGRQPVVPTGQTDKRRKVRR